MPFEKTLELDYQFIPEGEIGITIDKYKELTEGMTIEEALAIIGGPGEVYFENGKESAETYEIRFGYTGQGEVGANAIITFKGGKLTKMSQVGLQ